MRSQAKAKYLPKTNGCSIKRSPYCAFLLGTGSSCCWVVTRRLSATWKKLTAQADQRSDKGQSTRQGFSRARRSAILLIRGERVILDRELARLYGVSTKALNQAVRRNLDRFPEDFMFQLTVDEARAWREESRPTRLRSQVTLKQGRGQHIKYRPYAFTEHGILMLSSVLKSESAVHVNIEIMRTFVRLRQMLASNAELARRLG